MFPPCSRDRSQPAGEKKRRLGDVIKEERQEGITGCGGDSLLCTYQLIPKHQRVISKALCICINEVFARSDVLKLHNQIVQSVLRVSP